MALIKCEECGQMVSDKASACPHCGCPVKVPMVCPECGETIAEGDIYCQKCGSPLNHNTQPQVEEQADYSWEDDEEKSNGNKRWLLLALAALLVAGGAAWYYWQQNQFHSQTENDEILIDTTSLEMDAPGIGLNANGMYSIKDCPTTYDGLEIEPHIASNGTLTSVVVKNNGEQTQVFNVNSALFENVTNTVHFLDANFDGYVDFMVGTGECEQSSALFLWSPDESKFVQALFNGNLSFSDGCRGFSFRPETKKVYCDGYSDTDTQYLMSWVENDLRIEEEFIQTFSPSMYYGKINHRYTILEPKTQKVIFSNDDPKQLPERWKKMAHVLTPEEEADYANNEAELLEEGTPDYNSDINEVKSWINGNWRCRSGSMIVDVAIGENMAVLWNGELYYRGPYTIEGNEIIFNRRNGSSDYIIIDKEHKRLKLSENEPMIRM